MACMPLALLAVQLAANGFEFEGSRVPLRPLAGLALVLGIMVFAGHPESLMFTVDFVALFAAFHVVRFSWIARASPAARGNVRRFGLGLFIAGCLGGALGAIQIWPFVEYLLRSASFASAARELAPWSVSDALVQIVPDPLGRLFGATWSERGLVPAFHESNAFFAGGSTLALAFAAAGIVRRQPVAGFFAVVAVSLAAYVYDVPIVSSVLGPLFGRGIVLEARASPIWCLSIAALAAFTVDELLSSSGKRARAAALGAAALGILASLACRGSLDAEWTELVSQSTSQLRELGEQSRAELDRIVAWTVVALASAALLPWLRLREGRTVLAAVLAVATLLQALIGFKECVGLSPDRFVMPRSSAMETLRSVTEGERVVLLSSGSLQPNLNVAPGISLVTSYDALEIRELDQLRADAFGSSGYGAMTLRASRRALALFGVRFVATVGDWVPIDTERTSRRGDSPAARWYLAAEREALTEPDSTDVTSAESVREEFTASREGLSGLVLHVLDEGSALEAELEIECVDAASGASVARRTARVAELRRFPNGRREFVLAMPPQDGSRGRLYAVTARIPKAEPDARVRLALERWAFDSPLDGARRRRDREGSGRFVLDVAYGAPEFERAGDLGRLVLHRWLEGRGTAWIVSNARAVADGDAAAQAVLDERFDPSREVVLEAPSASNAEVSRIELVELSRGPQSARFRASCGAPSYLVLAQAWFPGWKARIDGGEVELLRANGAFCAVALPAGECEVSLDYEPGSFRVGAWISLAALLAIAFVFVRGRSPVGSAR
jgi:hypothetical protein